MNPRSAREACSASQFGRKRLRDWGQPPPQQTQPAASNPNAGDDEPFFGSVQPSVPEYTILPSVRVQDAAPASTVPGVVVALEDRQKAAPTTLHSTAKEQEEEEALPIADDDDPPAINQAFCGNHAITEPDAAPLAGGNKMVLPDALDEEEEPEEELTYIRPTSSTVARAVCSSNDVNEAELRAAWAAQPAEQHELAQFRDDATRPDDTDDVADSAAFVAWKARQKQREALGGHPFKP